MNITLPLGSSYSVTHPTPAGALVCTLTHATAARCNGSARHVSRRDQPTGYATWSLDGVALMSERLCAIGGVRVWWQSHGRAILARHSDPSPRWDAPTDYLARWTPPPGIMAILRGTPVTPQERRAATRLRRKLRLAGHAITF